MAHREIGWEIANWWILYVLAAIGITILGYMLYRRYRLWRLGTPDNRSDDLGERVASFLKISVLDGILHRRFFSADNGRGFGRLVPKEPFPGIMHFLIFAGCGLLLLGAFTDFLSHYVFEFMEGNVYLTFCFLNDLGGVFVLVGVVMAVIRRYVQKPERLDNKLEDAVGLGLVFLVVITGFIVEGLRIVAAHSQDPGIALPKWEQWGFFGYAFAQAFDGLAASTQLSWYQGMWWFHILLFIGTMIYVGLSFSKLMHIVVSPLNVFFKSSRPKGALSFVDMETVETFGVSKIEEFTWKQLLDLDACTRCGKCQDSCPAYLSGKPLSPKAMIQDLKAHFEPRGAVLLKNKEAEESEETLIGNVIPEDVIWSCTTCRACQEMCPVYVEHIDKIIDMRRNLVLMQNKGSETVQRALKTMMTRGDPWAGAMFLRDDWAKDMDVKRLSEENRAEVLLWVGCTGALQERNIKVTQAVARILSAAGVDFGILSVEETCCGEPARRLGHELTFQTMAEQNIDTFKRYGVKKIVTPCPHCFNTIKNEYPQFKGDFEVVHHTEFIKDLIEQGKLKLTSEINKRITYHDPCYLGRYNDVYEPPREILEAVVSGDGFVEMERSGRRSFCCGGGGGHMWMEETVGRRTDEIRIEDIVETECSVAAVACPFCLQMLEEAARRKKIEESLEVLDLAELVEKAM